MEQSRIGLLQLFLLFYLCVNGFGQGNREIKNGWYYTKKQDGYFNDFDIYELSFYKSSKLKYRSVYQSGRKDLERLGSARFYNSDANPPKEIMYVWFPYYGQRHLASLDYNPDDIDSSYVFYPDGMSIKYIRYSDKYRKPTLHYKLGERYMFDFPSPIPDTLPAFFEKVKKGCPYKPCTVIDPPGHP